MGVVATAPAEIDGQTYEITTWPASVALERMAECVALLGYEGLSVALTAFGRDDDQRGPALLAAFAFASTNAASVKGGLAGFAKRMLSGAVLVRQVNGATVRESTADNFDALFTGKLPVLAHLLATVAQRNFFQP